MSTVTPGVEQHKARIIDTVNTNQQRAERLEVLSKRKQERLRWRQMSTTRRVTRGVEQNKASSIGDYSQLGCKDQFLTFPHILS